MRVQIWLDNTEADVYPDRAWCAEARDIPGRKRDLRVYAESPGKALSRLGERLERALPVEGTTIASEAVSGAAVDEDGDPTGGGRV